MPDTAHMLAQIDDQLSGMQQRITQAKAAGRHVEVLVIGEAFERLLGVRFTIQSGRSLAEHVTEDPPCGS